MVNSPRKSVNTSADLISLLPAIANGHELNEKDKDKADEVIEHDFLRFLVADFQGIARCKVVTRSAYDSMKKKGPGMAWKTVLLSFDNYFNCTAKRVDGGKLTDARATPAVDVTIPRHLSWAGCDGKYNVGAVMCETFWGADYVQQEACPRYIARRLCDELKRDHHLQILHATEMEFVIFGDDGKPLFEDGSLYNPQQFSLLEEELLKVSQALEEAGVPIETLQTEFGPGQIEVVMKPAYGVEGADNEFLLKNGVKEMLQKPGQYSRATFMSKPIINKAGSAAHFNHSLWWSHENGTTEDAMYDEKSEHGLTKTAEHWLAGLLKHAPALTALSCPTVNCWRRLHVAGGTRDIGTPHAITWGVEARLCMIRVLSRGAGGATYFENRLPGAAMNPYLGLAGVVAAGMDGLRNGLTLPPSGTAENFNGLLPTNLEGALVALDNDVEIRELLGPEFVDWFVDVKRKEIQHVKERSEEVGDSFQAELDFYSKWL